MVYDGPQEIDLPDDKRVRFFTHDKPYGRREATKTAISQAKGKYLLKIDAHCMIGENYDTILKEDCEDNWMVVPTRFMLDAPNCTVINDQKKVEAMFYLYPYTSPARPKLTCRPWPDRAEARTAFKIDEDMGFQGSLWFMTKTHYERIGGTSELGYGSFVSEPEELGLKTQLGPWEGKVMRNKKTWYAHYAKPQKHWSHLGPGMMGFITEKEWWDAWTYCADFWFYNRWKERKHDIDWLIDKFWPLPRWPEDWRTKYDRQYCRDHSRI